jgi:hypothetical protein
MRKNTEALSNTAFSRKLSAGELGSTEAYDALVNIMLRLLWVNRDWVRSRRYSPEDRTHLKADIVSMPQALGAFVTLSNEEYDHARQSQLPFTGSPPHALEQRQADWG